MSKLSRLVLLLLVLLSGCDSYDPDQTAAYLADLGITGYQLEPSFSSSTFDYVATIPPGTDSITVEVTSAHQGATVTVNGRLVESDGGSITLQLAAVTNTIKVVVLSPDKMRTQTYTVIVSKQLLSYAVGGTVSGLTGALTLQNNAGDDLAIAGDGAFEFATPVTDGDDYAVTVSSQPAGQMCSVTNGAGTIASADVSDVAVDCVDLVAGLFIDDFVEGLVYWCSSGTWSETTADGSFACPQGDEITFWLGGNELGPVSSSSIITPHTLFPNDSLAALNLARLLQSFDSDQLPDNGVIVIDDTLVALLPQNVDFSLPEDEFGEAMSALGISLVSMDVAQQNLNHAIAQYVPENTAPIAGAGPDQNVGAGSTVTLNGSGSSDADGDGLTYRWSFVSRPAGSSAALLSPFTVGSSFVADIAGSYVISLIVFDGTLSGYDTVMVTAGSGAGLPAAPQNLQAVGGDALVALTWGAVGGATSYKMYYNTTGNVSTSDAWTSGLTSTVINFGSLTNGTTYYHRVAAVNASGEGPLSNEASAMPQAPAVGLPAMPQGVQAIAGNSLVTLNWTAVSGATSYTVYWNTTGGVDNSDAGIAAGSSTGLNHTGLTNGTNYYYRVAASNASGEGPLSATRLAIPTGPPPVVSYTVGGAVVGLAVDGTLTLQNNGTDDLLINQSGSYFTFPTAIPDGSTYNVTVSVQPDGQNCTVTYLGSGTIAGANVTNVGVTCVDIVTPPSVPAAPQGFLAVAGDASVVLSWTTVSGADSYTVYWNTAGNVSTSDASIAAGASTQLAHTGLANGTTYYYRVAATNGSGEGALSAEALATPAVPATEVPGVPQGLQAVPGDQAVTLTWTAVDGADSYTLYWTDTGVFEQGGSFAVGSNTQFIHTGLTNGTNYIYRVSATNTLGEGIPSSIVSAVPVIPVPKALRATIGDGQVQLDWATVDGGSYSYTVYWSATDDVTTASTSIAAGSSNQIIHDGLSSGVTYYYRVSATGAAGEGELSGTIASTQQPAWQWANPLPYSASIADGVWGNNMFVAVGYGGRILTSRNGADWSIQNSGTIQTLSSIAWSGSEFVAVGVSDNGRAVVRSTDGETWTAVSSEGYYNSVVWDGSKFVAVGNSGAVQTSSDGISWTTGIADNRFNLEKLVWNGMQFVAWAYPGYIFTSQDGITWTNRSIVASNAYDIVWDGTRYLAPSYTSVYSSIDGVTWVDIGAPNVLLAGGSVIWDGVQFVGTGPNGLIATSNDGLDWTAQTTNTDVTITSIVSNGSQYVAGGGGLILSSEDAQSWTQQFPTASVTGSHLMDVVRGGGQFVAVGYDGTIITSPNGDVWTRRTPVDSSIWFLDVEWNGSQFIAVGSNGIYTSPDGVTWTARDSGVAYKYFSNAAWDGHQFVLTSYAKVLTSPDGVTWTAVNLGWNYTLNSVVWNGSIFVAVGAGAIWTSPDGVTWTKNPSSFSQNGFAEVVWGNNQFVVNGRSGWVHTSPDGLIWTTHYIGQTYLFQLNWDGSQFVGTDSYDIVYTSLDGASWSVTQSTGSDTTLWTIAWDDAGKAVAVGDSGVILTNSAW